MFTEEIAGFIAEISYEQLPIEAINTGKMAILDCLGVTLASCEEISGKIISEYVRDAGRPEAGIIGRGFKTSVDQTAWANGTQAHALDYDDYFVLDRLTPYHPTVVILPAVLAVGEKNHLSGKDVLLAYITGFEVEARIALACAKQQYELGWHVTSTLGSLSAAAAVAKMLGLDEKKIRVALGIAGSFAGGLRKNFRTMTKPLHAGNAARNGVVSAVLAQSGFTADNDILDSPLSFYEVLGGEKGHQPEISEIKQGAETAFYILSPGISFKPYPSCAYSHWAIDAALDIKKEYAVSSRDIVDIECRTSSALPHVLIHHRPVTALEGKFSLEFCVAICFIDGEVSLKQFSDHKVRDSAVQNLMGKVRYVHPPEMGAGLADLKGELLVKLQNGKVFSRKIDIARGNPQNPIDKETLERKYRDCARLALSQEDVNRSLDLISHLDSVNDIAELMDILTFGNECM